MVSPSLTFRMEVQRVQMPAKHASRRLSSFGLSRQPTAAQKRRMEDRRGIDRDGARRRFKRDLARNRERKPGS